VDLIGIEPMTSSMPWKRAPKLRHRPTLFSVAVTCNFLSVYDSRGVRQTGCHQFLWKKSVSCQVSKEEFLCKVKKINIYSLVPSAQKSSPFFLSSEKEFGVWELFSTGGVYSSVAYRIRNTLGKLRQQAGWHRSTRSGLRARIIL